MDLGKELNLLLKTGKVVYGIKEVTQAIYFKKVLGIIIARGIPEHMFNKLLYYAKIFSVPYYIYEGSSRELGVLCGKKFPISSIAILSPGESSILSIFEISK